MKEQALANGDPVPETETCTQVSGSEISGCSSETSERGGKGRKKKKSKDGKKSKKKKGMFNFSSRSSKYVPAVIGAGWGGWDGPIGPLISIDVRIGCSDYSLNTQGKRGRDGGCGRIRCYADVGPMHLQHHCVRPTTSSCCCCCWCSSSCSRRATMFLEYSKTQLCEENVRLYYNLLSLQHDVCTALGTTPLPLFFLLATSTCSQFTATAPLRRRIQIQIVPDCR